MVQSKTRQLRVKCRIGMEKEKREKRATKRRTKKLLRYIADAAQSSLPLPVVKIGRLEMAQK